MSVIVRVIVVSVHHDSALKPISETTNSLPLIQSILGAKACVRMMLVIPYLGVSWYVSSYDVTYYHHLPVNGGWKLIVICPYLLASRILRTYGRSRFT